MVMFTRAMVRFVLGLSAVLQVGCVVPYRIDAVPTQHIVMVDSQGRLMDPTGSVFCRKTDIDAENKAWVDAEYKAWVKDPSHEIRVAPPLIHSWTPCNGRINSMMLKSLDPKMAARYISDLFDHMDAYYRDRQPTGRQERKVVLIIHGGLNTNKSTTERAQRLSKRLLDDGYYPIFINWQSNLPLSLWEHTVTTRQGNYLGWKQGVVLAPFYLIGDLGRAISRAPVIWGFALHNDLQRLAGIVHVLPNAAATETESVYQRVQAQRAKCCGPGTRPKDCTAVDVTRGRDATSKPEHARALARYAPTGLVPLRTAGQVAGLSMGGLLTYLPFKYLVSPLLDGFGSPAWEQMERHAILGFHADGQSVGPAASGYGSGGIAQFLKELRRRVNDDATSCRGAKKDTDCIDWHLTLIGHSMGAIVANHVVRNFDDLDFDTIVYMAAACSVREYEDNVLTYMSHKRHAKTQMYHLVLSRDAEIRDQYFYGIPPSGSLLVWIDKFFTQPRTLRDRTAGRFENLMRFIEETPETLAWRVHVRAFGSGELFKDEPQHHGAFLDFDEKQHPDGFWRENFLRIPDSAQASNSNAQK
jgi:pimeloyl-ACP methyl ester carboxylesterase